MDKFTVTINYRGRYGYMEYDPATKKANVVLDLPEQKAAAEKFLSEPVTLDLPEGTTIRDFVSKTLDPLSSQENFKLSITKLWFKTGIRVEWSMPPGMTESLV